MQYLAIAVILALTVAYVISSLRASAQLKRAKRERNEIYRNCFLKGLAGILAKMSNSDGSTSDDEEQIILKLFADMGLPASDVKLCKDAYRMAKDGDLPGSYYASLFAPYSTRESRILVYEVLWDIAAADERFAAGEQKMLHEILAWLELDESFYEVNMRNHEQKFATIEAAVASAKTKLEGVVKANIG